MTYIALLRAVNLAGHKPVAMSDLKRMLEETGFSGARSVLQSGNLVFRADAREAEIERLLEKEARDRLNLATEFFVRSAREWRTIVAANPMSEEARHDPAHLLLTLTKTAVEPEQVEALRAAIVGPEKVSGHGRHLYVFYPAGIGRSRLTNALIERKLGTRVTARNWNTVMKLATIIEDQTG
jgi:uncharacterized protein (DUF1697 family)